MQTYSSLFSCNGSNCLENKGVFFIAVSSRALQHAVCTVSAWPVSTSSRPKTCHEWLYRNESYLAISTALHTKHGFFEGWKFPCLFLNPAIEYFGDLWVWRMVEWNLTSTSFLLYRIRTKPTLQISIKNYYHHLKQLKQKKLAQTKVPAQLPWPHFSPVRAGICILQVT